MRAGCPRVSRSAWRRSGRPVDEHRSSPDSAEEDDTEKACGPQVDDGAANADGTANADGIADVNDIAHDEGLAHHIAHGVAQCINVEDIDGDGDDGDCDYDGCTGGREPPNPEPRRGAGAGASRSTGTQVPAR